MRRVIVVLIGSGLTGSLLVLACVGTDPLPTQPSVSSTDGAVLPDGAAPNPSEGGTTTNDDGGEGGTECTRSSECDDRNDCTEDRCEANTCVHINENAPGVSCDDGNPCTTNDTCIPREGRCVGNPLCDDKNPCTSGNRCQVDGGCSGTAYTCPAANSASAVNATCDGDGGCRCPQAKPALCAPPRRVVSSGCFEQCCPGDDPDRPMTCNGGTHTSRCSAAGALICVPP